MMLGSLGVMGDLCAEAEWIWRRMLHLRVFHCKPVAIPVSVRVFAPKHGYTAVGVSRFNSRCNRGISPRLSFSSLCSVNYWIAVFNKASLCRRPDTSSRLTYCRRQ